MNPTEDTLSKALRDLAATSPHGAPAELGDRLKGAFARHHARRRQRRVALISAAVLGMIIAVAWLGAGRRPSTLPPRVSQAAPPSPVSPTVVAQAIATVATPSATVAQATGRRSPRKVKVHGDKHVVPPNVVAQADFVALPSFDPAIPIGESRILRVELPGTALQLIGYPANEQLLERRVVTDLLVGQDGLPYAVRLVQARSTH